MRILQFEKLVITILTLLGPVPQDTYLKPD